MAMRAARVFAHKAEAVRQRPFVDLDHDAVHFVADLVAFVDPARVLLDHAVQVGAEGAVRRDRKAEIAQQLQTLPLRGRQVDAFPGDEIVHVEGQRPCAVLAGSSWRSEPAAVLRGFMYSASPASARAAFSASNLSSGKKTSPRTDQIRRAGQAAVRIDRDAPRESSDRAQILGDVLAYLTVAARRALHETGRRDR